jgi:hypothetical protein
MGGEVMYQQMNESGREGGSEGAYNLIDCCVKSVNISLIRFI